MKRESRAIWTESDLRGLLTDYFGHKLEPTQLDQLIADVSDALAERSRSAPAARESDFGSYAGGA